MFKLYLSFSTKQASPRLWEILGHKSYMLSVDVLEGDLSPFKALDLMLDSGAFRSVSKGKSLKPEEVLKAQKKALEVLKALPVVYDYPLNALKAEDKDYELANEKTLKNVMLWSKEFGNDFLPVVHAKSPRVLKKYLNIYESMGFKKIALGSLALLSRYKPALVLMLIKEAKEVFGRIHALGVGNSLALAIAHLNLAESADSSSYLQDAKYGMVRYPEDMSMVVVAKRKTTKRKVNVEKVYSRCNCPACSRRGLEFWSREGFVLRSIHNAYWLLKALKDVNLAERIISRRRSLWNAYLKLKMISLRA